MDTRTRVLAGTVLAQLGLGTVYSWSILNPALANHYDTKTFSIAMTFSVMMISLSVSTLTINWLQARFGVRKVLMACGVVLALGLFAAAFAPNVVILYLTAGVVVGCADGIGYLLSLTNCLRWFPEKAGTISGICVGAYGLPAFRPAARRHPGSRGRRQRLLRTEDLLHHLGGHRGGPHRRWRHAPQGRPHHRPLRDPVRR